MLIYLLIRLSFLFKQLVIFRITIANLHKKNLKQGLLFVKRDPLVKQSLKQIFSNFKY